VSIRPGWFYHPAEDARVRTLDNLVNLYLTSVGRNGKLLLNVPPTRDGLLHATDVVRLADFRGRLDTMFARDVADGAKITWQQTGPRTAVLDLELAAPAMVGYARLEENITRGQRVAAYQLTTSDGSVLSRGSTIGCTKIDRLPGTEVQRVRLSIEDAAAEPERVRVKLYGA
jgi:alpha-L-fucosidase